MDQDRLKMVRWCPILTGIILTLIAVMPCQAGSGLKLYVSRAPGVGPDTTDVQFAEDGDSIVYRQDRVLHKIPLSTAIPQAISPGVIYDYTLTGDRLSLVYALGSHNENQDLYSVSLDTGVQTDINLTLYNFNPSRQILVPDGSGLVLQRNNQLQLKPITGEDAMVLIDNLTRRPDMKVAPDSSRVYMQDYFLARSIQSIAVAGGPVTEYPRVPDGRILGARFTPDGAYMIDHLMNIFALDGSLASWQPVRANFFDLDQVSPDQKHITYTGRAYDPNKDDFRSLSVSSVPFDGSGPGVDIFPEVGPDHFLDFYTITPDSRSVIVGADLPSEDVSNLYIAPITGGTPVLLNEPVATGSGAVFAGITNNDEVVYRSQALGDTVEHLFRAPLAGGTSTLIPTPGITTIPDAVLTPNKQIVLFIGADTEGLNNLYAVPVSGGPAVPMSDPFDDSFITIELDAMQFSPDGTRAIFMIRSNTHNNFHRYSIVGVPLAVVEAGTDVSGGITGGAGFIGGIDYYFASLSSGGVMKAVYESQPFADMDPALVAEIDFILSGDIVQYWKVTLDGTFEGLATLTFNYDENLLGPGTTEDSLLIYHQLSDSTFEVLPVLGRDFDNNTITVTTDSFSNFTLGMVPEPGSLLLVAVLMGPCIVRRM